MTKDKRTIRERLAVIETQMGDLIKGFDNHLHTHKNYTYLFFSTTIGMIVTLILILIKIH